MLKRIMTGAIIFLTAAAFSGACRAADICKDYCYGLTGGEFRVCMEKCNRKNTGLYSLGELTDAGLKCPEGMAFVPAGEFRIGCDMDDCGKDESPLRQVRITKPFCLDEREVTQGQFKRAMDKNPSSNKLLCGINCPVDSVTWTDANNYCRFVKKRLPTEAEWEYAARGGSMKKYFWGAAMEAGYAWYEETADGRTHPAGKTKPNIYGLFDMLGNVWEWTQDCYSEDWYARMPDSDPVNDEPGCALHVARGDSWTSYTVSASRRYANYHNSADQGFRCAWDFPEVRE